MPWVAISFRNLIQSGKIEIEKVNWMQSQEISQNSALVRKAIQIFEAKYVWAFEDICQDV